jgi:hypothetical protein
MRSILQQACELDIKQQAVVIFGLTRTYSESTGWFFCSESLAPFDLETGSI